MDDSNPATSNEVGAGAEDDGPDGTTNFGEEESAPVGGSAAQYAPIASDVSGAISDQLGVPDDMDALIEESGIESPYFALSDWQQVDGGSHIDTGTLLKNILAHKAVPNDIEVPKDISRENLIIANDAANEFQLGKEYVDWVHDSNQFGLKNGFTGRKHGRNQWVCSCSTNTNFQKKRSGLKKIDRADSSMSSDCPFKLFFSIKKDQVPQLMKVFPFHNHPCNPRHAKAAAKKSGRANRLAVRQLIDVLGPMMINRNKINISQARKIMRPFVGPSFDLSSQSIFNVLVGVRLAVEKGEYKIPQQVQVNPFEAINWNLADKSTENIRNILAEIYDSKDSERSWIVMSLMERLKREDDSFDYKVHIDKEEEIDVVTWQIGRSRGSLEKYGDLIFLDGRKSTNMNSLHFHYITFVVIDPNHKFIPASESFVFQEQPETYEIVVDFTLQMTPGYSANQAKFGWSDYALNQDIVSQWFPNITFLLDTYHFCSSKNTRCILALDFGPQVWLLISDTFRAAVHASTEEECLAFLGEAATAVKSGVQDSQGALNTISKWQEVRHHWGRYRLQDKIGHQLVESNAYAEQNHTSLKQMVGDDKGRPLEQNVAEVIERTEVRFQGLQKDKDKYAITITNDMEKLSTIDKQNLEQPRAELDRLPFELWRQQYSLRHQYVVTREVRGGGEGSRTKHYQVLV